MKREKFLALIMLMVMTMLTSGCASIKDKFIRKPKEEEEQIRRYQVVREYDVHPNMELYTKRYIFWKNWNKELLEKIRSDNHKKRVVAVEQAVSNLYDMKRMLVDEKGDQLQGLIDEMTDVENTIKNERITGANRVRIRRKVESVGRNVKKDFSYTKVKGQIRDDFRRE